MRHRLLRLLTTLSLMTTLCLAGSPATRTSPTTQKGASIRTSASRIRDITVVAVEGKISPDIVRVHRGDLVRLTFKAKDGTYGVSIPSLKIKGKATPERPVYVEFAATSEGEYVMRCTKFWGFRHWSENGKIVVE